MPTVLASRFLALALKLVEEPLYALVVVEVKIASVTSRRCILGRLQQRLDVVENHLVCNRVTTFLTVGCLLSVAYIEREFRY